MDADYEYLRRIGYREVGRLLIGKMLTGISYVGRQPDRQGAYWRLAFLPFDTLTLELSARCSIDLLREIEADSAKLIARRGERFELSADGQNIVLGGEGADLGEADADIAS